MYKNMKYNNLILFHMAFTDNVYRFECDNSIVGKLEDTVLQLLNWRVEQLTEMLIFSIC
jgi:hypothetical protein